MDNLGIILTGLCTLIILRIVQSVPSAKVCMGVVCLVLVGLIIYYPPDVMNVVCFSAYIMLIISMLYALSWCNDSAMLCDVCIYHVAFILGFYLLVISQDVISMYVGMELASFSAFLWIIVRAQDIFALEVGIKYLVVHIIGSMCLVLALCMLAFIAHSVHIVDIIAYLSAFSASQDVSQVWVSMILVLWIMGLVIKMGIAPLQDLVADTYQAVAPIMLGFLGIMPRLMVWVVLWHLRDIRLLNPVVWLVVWSFFAVMSWIMGHVAALQQERLSRLMAYAGVAQMGWVALAVALGTDNALYAALDFLLVYAAAWMMWVGCMVYLLHDDKEIQWLDQLSGLPHMKGYVYWSVIIIVSICTMSGLPPLIGFWVKFGIIRAAITPLHIILACCGMIGSVIGAVYYVRIIYYAVVRSHYHKLRWINSPGVIIPMGLGCVLACVTCVPVVLMSM